MTDSNEDSEMSTPFIRYVLAKHLMPQDQYIDDDTEIWQQIKPELKYYAYLMHDMQNDTLWQAIMKSVTKNSNDEIDSALEKYKYKIIDEYETIVFNEEVESQEEDNDMESILVDRDAANCLPFFRTKHYLAYLAMKKRCYY